MTSNLNYTYVSPDMLTEGQKWTIFRLRKSVAFMQDNFPTELDEFLGNLARNRNTSDISTN